MTPYEISEPVLDIIFNDMENDGYFTEEVLSNFTIMDPTCGVGTLLIESANHFSRYLEKKKIIAVIGIDILNSLEIKV